MNNCLMIHVGTGKTGTSALQKFLYDNAQALSDRGWVYPDLVSELNDHIRIKMQLSPKNGVALKEAFVNNWNDRERGLLWAVIGKHLLKGNVILSEEGLWGHPSVDSKMIIQEVRRRFDNIKVVCYLRRQDLYLESSWNQNVKQSIFDTDLLEFANNYDAVNYKRKLDEYASVIGKENVIVRVYENGQFEGSRNDITSDFLKVCGIEDNWPGMIMPGRVNERLDGKYLEIKHEFNKKIIASHNKIKIRLDKIIINNSKTVEKVGYYSKLQREEILKMYSADNEYIAREYLKRDDGILFKDTNVDIPQYEYSLTEMEKEIIGILAECVREYEDELDKARVHKSSSKKLLGLFRR